MNNKTYKVFVTQQVSTYVDVTAESEDRAYEMVSDMLVNGEVSFDDFSTDQRIEVDGVVCLECENVFEENQGAFKKDSEDTWLCDDCLQYQD